MSELAFTIVSRKVRRRHSGFFTFTEHKTHGVAITQASAVHHLIRITSEMNVNNNKIALDEVKGDKFGGKASFVLDMAEPHISYDVWFTSLPILEEP